MSSSFLVVIVICHLHLFLLFIVVFTGFVVRWCRHSLVLLTKDLRVLFTAAVYFFVYVGVVAVVIVVIFVVIVVVGIVVGIVVVVAVALVCVFYNTMFYCTAAE